MFQDISYCYELTYVGFYLLGGRGRGKLPPNLSASPPKVFPEKVKAISNTDLI